MSGPVRYLLLALLAGAIIAIDQVTKLSIVQSMRLNESIPIVPNLFSLTYIRNPGAAFGLLAGSSDAFRMVFFCLLWPCWGRSSSGCRRGIGWGSSVLPEFLEGRSGI
jgi:lipoprotein signal peptidase